MKPTSILIALSISAISLGQYTPTLPSLEKHIAAPEWFLDAKFGIYCHWGPYSVPAYGNEWYPRNMFIKGSNENKFHIAKYGDPSKFGYDGLVPLFKAENFDANTWADLFKKAGARFAGPVSEHHDGFAMWDTKLTPWNSVEMGPKRDITGELEKAIRAQGMKFITTFHHSRNALWQQNGQWTGHYDHVLSDYPSVLNDPKLAFLYGYMPHDKFVKLWKDKLEEVIDKYQPDLIWFDSWLNEIPPKDQNEFLAYYFNKAKTWGRDVLVTCKNGEMAKNVTVEDFEKGRLDDLTAKPWLTDDTVSWGSWSYTDNLELKDSATVIKTLVDIVSKNGILLLNASPKADGTFPDDQKQVLTSIGEWLKTNGPAIYDTRPWLVYGEGPTKLGKGGHFVGRVNYTAQDIRYTRSKDNKQLNAITLGWPTTPTVTLDSVKVLDAPTNATISLLGYDKPVTWSVNAAQQLVINVPQIEGAKPLAAAFQIRGMKTTVHPGAMFARSNTIRLTPEKAVIDGHAQLETKEGKSDIGFWDSPTDSIHWLGYIPAPGDYAIRGQFATGIGASSVTLETDGVKTTFDIPNTGDWAKTTVVNGKVVHFKKAGIYHFTLKPTDPKKWTAINVFGIELAALPTEAK